VLFPLTSLVCLYGVGEGVNWDHTAIVEFPWVPSIGVNFSFLVDGLSLFFGFLVTGMGVLVNFYSQFYMTHRKRHLGRFYCGLNFFMSAMLGVIFSNNLILLFIFWELTGISSFILIGFLYHDFRACTGARMAQIEKK